MSFKKEIKTSIIINATAEKVWSILTNFEAYPKWNPFIKSLTGLVEVGQKIEVKLEGMTFKPNVVAFDAGKELSWLGSLLFKGIFDGKHNFIIHDQGDGTVLFEHSEQFNGLLVGLFASKLERDTRPGFVSMNEALKVYAERG